MQAQTQRRLTKTCPYCQKTAEVKSEEFIGTDSLLTYTCGHSVYRAGSTQPEIKDSEWTSLNGEKETYDYQKRGVEFVERANGTALIADAMGLGKTVQAAMLIRRHHEWTTLVVIKNSTLYQWLREYKEWTSGDDLGITPIVSNDAPVLAGLFKTYLISMDLLGRKGMVEKLLTLNLTTIIVDESHSFKDSGSKRAKALVQLVRQGQIEHKIFLTGTPIKNRANEYFTVLNLLAPEHFPSPAHFSAKWLSSDGKRIKPWLLEDFRRLTERWIIRREKNEVLKDLPDLVQNTIEIMVEDEWLRKSYNSQLDISRNMMNAGAKLGTMEILGILAKLRHLTAQAKVKPALEFIEEFLENTEDEKIAIGVHHKDVADSIFYALQGKGYGVLRIDGSVSPERKDIAARAFAEPQNRVMVISILAGGVGLNLQMCANTLILEREWCSTDEEQYVSRFHRNGQTKNVIADFMMAHGTVDEFLDRKVEEKKRIVGETISGWDLSSDVNSLREILNQTLDSRL